MIENSKQRIIELGRFLYNNHYIVATDGNISSRLNSKEILITRTGVCKGEMKIKDIIKIDINDLKHVGQGISLARSLSNPKGLPYKPSSEYRFHLAIYKNRPDINAVIHAHPTYCTVFAVKNPPPESGLPTREGSIRQSTFNKGGFPSTLMGEGKGEGELNAKLLTETEETLGKIGYVGYFKPGSLELAKAVGKASIKHNAIILAHHGVVVFGKDLTEARYRLERLEFLSKVTLLASLFKS